MAITKEILNSHPVGTLKKEIAKTNVKGYSKMKKAELVDLMMKHKEKFGHIQKADGKKVVLKPPKELKESTKPDKPKMTKEERDKRIAEIAKKQEERKAKKEESKPKLESNKTFVPNKKYPKVFSMLLKDIDSSGGFSETKYSRTQKDEKGKSFELKPEKNEATPIVNEYIKIVEKTTFGKNLLEQAEKALPVKPFTNNPVVETLDRQFSDFLGTSFGEQETYDNIKPKPAEASLKKLGEMFEERSRIAQRSKEDKNIIKKHKNLVSYMRSKPSQSEVNKAVDSDREYQVVKNRLESMYGNYLKKKP
jgi:hypothetical protein